MRDREREREEEEGGWNRTGERKTERREKHRESSKRKAIAAWRPDPTSHPPVTPFLSPPP